jgi:hypothetical protein
MTSGAKEAVGFPACMLIVILAVYGLIKLLMALPSSASAEGILGGMLMIGFIAVPLFFGTIIAVVAICMWMATTDNKP